VVFLQSVLLTFLGSHGFSSFFSIDYGVLYSVWRRITRYRNGLEFTRVYAF